MITFAVATATIIIAMMIFKSLINQINLKMTHKKKTLKFIVFNKRVKKIYSFEKISESILKDMLEAFKDQNSSRDQVSAMLPLLSDIRKHGEALFKQRKFYHIILFSDREKSLANKINQLREVENFLKFISRQKIGDKNTLPSSCFRKVSQL